jgi:hypothetical protein
LIPAASTKILEKDEGGATHHATWHYQGILGKLNFLEKSTCGELGYSVHQCARFCERPAVTHTKAVHHIEQETKALFFCQRKFLLIATLMLISAVYGIGTHLNTTC